MSVDREHVTAIASLARLRFDGDELKKITDELNEVLEHVETLQSLAVEEVPPDEDPLGSEGDTTRGSGAETPDPLAAPLEEIAPDSHDGFFIVPPLPGVHAEDGE